MPASDPKRFVLRCAALLPLLLAIPLANWLLSRPPGPAALMRDFDRMARALLAGKTVYTNVDARPLKIAYLRSAPVPAEVLILGSSRAHQISPAWFEPRTAWNSAVGFGGIDDAAAYFQVCLEAGKLPDFVLLEVSPTLTPGGVDVKDWRAMSPYLARALERYHLREPWQRRITELASLRQFKWNLSTFNGLHWQTAVPDRIEIGSVLPSGQIMFPQSLMRADSSIAAALSAPNRSRDHSRPDEFELQLFHHFLDDLRSRHIRVAVFLAPIHPVAYEYYSKLGGYDESWIRREMSARGIRVAGTYSPVVARATRDDFFDEVHPRATLCERLLREAGIIDTVPLTQDSVNLNFTATR